ncbi:type II toxin-antitoxin system VapC family toxin [Lysobacter sp. A6]|uniref:Ribonuclease VapC n=1 Tax=Noviluteimonas lactosilytica TaxID=2888523 RepID=A0ABS8JIK2_9GAMM|nr:type II toxin-antitoxin system VapC family toxin [Lysobacter lactosilyticus]MCC8363407.1 type II toxin-antitoxin system VapC family toxin [Lysobacter lactosilyticus]
MIALDTNVVSELMRATPDPRVLRWVDAQASDTLVVTAVTVAELLYGIARLPASRKRSQLEAAIAATFDEDLVILPFDDAAAVDYATIAASQELRGRTVSMADAMIAATCMAAGAALATRNTKDFADLGIDLVDPWR